MVAVQGSYSPDFRGGIGGGVWVGAVIGIDFGGSFDLPLVCRTPDRLRLPIRRYKVIGPDDETLPWDSRMEILPEGGGKTRPPVLNSPTVISWITAVVDEKFALVSISVVADACNCQALGTGRSRSRMRMEGRIWVDEWLGGRWDVTLSFFFIVLFGCATSGSMTEGQKLKDVHNGLLNV